MAVTPDNPLGMGPSAKLGEKPTPDFRRPKRPDKAIVIVWDAEGTPHNIARGNLHDALSRPGWSIRSPAAKQFAAENQASEDDNTEPDQGSSPEQTELDTAMDALNELRIEAEALGVTVDQRWGKKRLAAEIEKAKAVSDAE